MKRRVWLALLGCALLMVACSGAPIRKPVPAQMPAWCLKTSGTVTDATRGKLVLGVGIAQGIKAPELARNNADNAARTEIAKQFNAFSEYLLNEYKEQPSLANAPDAADKVQALSRVLAKLEVRGAAIEDRYVDETNNTWYSLAVVPYGDFSTLILKSAELSDDVKAFVKDKADGQFTRLPKSDSQPAVTP